MSFEDTYKKIGFDISYLPLVFGALVTIFVVNYVYGQTQNILKERLRQRIESMVSIAALQINGDDIQKIIQNNLKMLSFLSSRINI